jgi:hypothetical protein
MHPKIRARRIEVFKARAKAWFRVFVGLSADGRPVYLPDEGLDPEERRRLDISRMKALTGVRD